jgi:predicted nucleic acid-binding protein
LIFPPRVAAEVQTLVLVDTSVWVDFFRGDKAARGRLDALLRDGLAGVCGPTFAEVVSGASSGPEMQRLALLLRALPWLELVEDAWSRVAEVRFTLARAGVAASLVDILIALTAFETGAVLLTRDRDFARIQRVVPLSLEIF